MRGDGNIMTLETESYISEVFENHSTAVFKICMVMLKNKQDAEDVFQEVFVRLMQNTKPFESNAHCRAWLCKVAVNCCKNQLKCFWKRRVIPSEYIHNTESTPQQNEMLQDILKLPPNYRTVIHLHYYEGYKPAEIAKIMNKSEQVIYNYLHRAKQQLKLVLEGVSDNA
jgi:RNA polymerase sigma factor (sigma-70 family)